MYLRSYQVSKLGQKEQGWSITFFEAWGLMELKVFICTVKSFIIIMVNQLI